MNRKEDREYDNERKKFRKKVFDEVVLVGGVEGDLGTNQKELERAILRFKPTLNAAKKQVQENSSHILESWKRHRRNMRARWRKNNKISSNDNRNRQ